MIFALLLWACSPTCEKTCKKLVSCGDIESPEMNQQECESACNAQVNLYEDQQDETKQNALDDFKSCVVEETCEDLVEGVCYDEEVYPW